MKVKGMCRNGNESVSIKSNLYLKRLKKRRIANFRDMAVLLRAPLYILSIFVAFPMHLYFTPFNVKAFPGIPFL